MFSRYKNKWVKGVIILAVKNPEFSDVIFYTCGTCNLKCRYCGIHKSPILNKIDERLAESFKGDYYFNRVKEYFP